MSEDISLLPDELRKKEEELKKAPAPPKTEEKVKMYIPKAEDEDIEVIEVDEGEVGQVLEGESPVARLLFKAQSLFEDLKSKLFEPRVQELPPKLPPQFFKAPAPKKPGASGLVPSSTPGAVAKIQPAPGSAGEAKVKARIMPEAQAPRRVRVIRRVRKPVRMSFLTESETHPRVDISRRRATLIITAVTFVVLLGGAYALLVYQGDRAGANVAEANARLAAIQTVEKDKLAHWDAYRDLEPHLKALSQVLDRHLSPSRLFDALEKNTVPDVSYSSFTLSPDNHLILGATAPTFSSAARQVVAFENSGIARSVQALGYQARYTAEGTLESVNFQIGLTLDPNATRALQPAPVATR